MPREWATILANMMTTRTEVHRHFCNTCWNLYECECTGAFAPESYRCKHCTNFHSDAEFLQAIGVSWDGELPAIEPLKAIEAPKD
jgi:hypothetical protein